MKIKKNMKFVCIKDVLMEDDGEVNYVKGDVYISEQDGAITNMLGEKGHLWSNGEEFKQHFIPYSQLDRVYTKHTPLLEKIFDKYEGKKLATEGEEIKFFDNVACGDTGWFVSTSGFGEYYYKDEGYTFLSEKAFIEFMDLGKYIGSLNVESGEVSTKRDSRQVGEEVPDYLNIVEEWSKEGEKDEKILKEAKQRQQELDAINPQHYKGKIEVIDFIEDKGLGFHLANAVKYIARMGKKDIANPKEDLKKAIWYIERYINTYLDGDER